MTSHRVPPELAEAQVLWNLRRAVLYEHAVQKGQGQLSHDGAIVINTVPYTGRSPKDKFVVREPQTADHIWWGEVNVPFEEDAYMRLRGRVLAYLQGQRTLYGQDVYAGAHPQHRIRVRMITESPVHALFARNMFLPLEGDHPVFAEYTILHAPYFKATPETDGTRSEAFIILHLGRKEVIIGGTAYAGEVKKSIFTALNYELPLRDVLSMHCSANYGQDKNDVSLFFGLSGTGKTTLSMDTERTIIGDDEHGWADDGVFNFEGGSYAKVIRLSAEHEPLIWQAVHRFGAILENVVVDPETRIVDFNDARYTENTRGSFPLSFLPNADLEGRGGHPKVVFFLSADAFGVLPPLAKLTPEQIRDYFLLGYTAKLAGTERGVKDPKATFSAAFGAPFLVHPPQRYADMLVDLVQRNGTEVWLLNTGWTGGPYGVGHRFPLPYTRAMVHAVQRGLLREVPMEREPYFGLYIPTHVPGVPDEVLKPWQTWQDQKAYEEKAAYLKKLFEEALAKIKA
ncbi:MAG: phosphoenolpyruvate carboxykinase (ATP) [Chloroflexi bacterium]|nr:phosphoenolpyruvate carboxykinase (ATP) [Chloroflexota bacterium]